MSARFDFGVDMAMMIAMSSIFVSQRSLESRLAKAG